MPEVQRALFLGCRALAARPKSRARGPPVYWPRMPPGLEDARQIRPLAGTRAQRAPDFRALARDPDANRRSISAVRQSCPAPAALRARFPERALAWPSGRVV